MQIYLPPENNDKRTILHVIVQTSSVVAWFKCQIDEITDKIIRSIINSQKFDLFCSLLPHSVRISHQKKNEFESIIVYVV